MHICSDAIEWTTRYHHTSIHDTPAERYRHVFLFNLLPKLREVGTSKPAEVLFTMSVGLVKNDECNLEDQQWERMGRTAEKITGSIGAGGTHVDWDCEKLDRVQPEPLDEIPLFRLKTTTPLRLVRGSQTCYSLDIKLTFHLGGSLKDKIPLLSDLLYPLPLPSTRFKLR